jgi:preprotein translocase subunit SecF
LLLIVQSYALRNVPGLVAVLKPYDGCGLVLAVWAALAVVVFIGLGFAYEFKNGTELQFNRGQELRYESAVASALKAAEPLKAAQDHRLSVQIRDAEAAVKTIRKQMSSVQAVLDRL